MVVEYRAAASAPGKAIIFGEHAVVYGVSAIAAALSDLRMTMLIDVVEGPSEIYATFGDILNEDESPLVVTLSTDRVKELVPIDNSNPLETITPTPAVIESLTQEFSSLPHAAGQCMTAIAYLFAGIVLPIWKHSSHSFKFSVKSNGLPLGAGLGSSAAFSVATAGALLQLYFKLTAPNQTWTSALLTPAILESINNWSFIGEVLIHGTPSGLDNTTSCYGGMVKFQRTELGNTFETLKHGPRLNILLTNTKVPRSTKALVAGVRVLFDALPGVVKPIFASIDEITAEFMRLSEQYHNKELDDAAVKLRLDQLFRINQSLLDALGVSHPSLVEVVMCAAQNGFVSKLTGAGGGGCAITLLDAQAKVEECEPLQTLMDALQSKGFDVFCSGLGGDGVRWL